MLHFIVGTAGTGKTENMLEKMRAFAENGAKIVYLVPEQYSFEAERQVHRRLGGKLSLCVEVLSFTRLCNSVFREYGGLAGVSLTKTAKYLLMSIAVEQVREKLSLYRKSCANTAFLEVLVKTCSELKTAGITCERLADFASFCKDDALREKLSELSLIYTAYQSLIERGYSDSDDDLPRVCELLENNDFFGGATVFVDGFTTFMAAEFELLGHVIAQAGDVYFAMTADEISDYQRGMGVFSAAKSAINRLSRLAKNNGITIGEPEVLTRAHRFKRPELAYLSKNFMRPAALAYDGEYTSALSIISAADSYAEMERTAAEIARLVREENCRYSEIAVVARDPAPYERAIETAFSRHKIPYFLSTADDIENKPLFSCVLAALNAVRGGLDATLVLLFAKSPLLGLDSEDIALLENYCYCWSVRASLWHEDFTLNPRGLAGALTESDAALLDRINATRVAVIRPLMHLKEAVKAADSASFARGIFELLTEINAAENLKRFAETLELSDAFLDESAQLWDILMDVLDIFGTVLSGCGMSAARMCELFRLAVNAAEIGSVPQTLDQVLIGGADRIRPQETRAVFVIGANEGVFPAQISASGVFSDAERTTLIDGGLEISAPTQQKSVLEKYFAYFALTLPSQWLFVSFSSSDLKGRELLPSIMISHLRELFPALPAQKQDILCGISTEESAFDALSAHIREDTPLSATLREFFSNNEHSAALERMTRAATKKQHKIANVDTARELFGSFMRLSPSRVERFYKCPFSYFALDGLQLRARSKVEFTGIESGSVIHHVLQVMLQKHGGKGIIQLSNEQISAEVIEIIREYLAQRVEDIEKLPARMRFLFERLTGLLSRLLRRLGEEFAQSSFAPAAFELPIKLGAEIEPLRLETADGTSVVVEGIVDRVDVMNKGGKRYIRVVDYKSGVKNFALEDVLYGLNMQMLLYLFTIAENGVNELAGAIPAGVLYMPAREKYISVSRDADAENVHKTRAKEWSMSGLLLEDEEVLRAMERDVAGLYIPAKLDKSGNLDASSSLATRAELGKLARKVKAQVAQMAQLLGKGAIEACPIEDNGGLTCEYCDYRAVCGFEPGDAVKQIAKLDKDEFFKILQEEGERGD